ncbi:hypothetical protein [Xanthomonas graminis]|uniref:hypothetical protein n=1 Tax=Xanthomonas graminis TaxID=3390026 RepID=UPI002541E1E0|nr:hypothetical protein [Xanthomonas translucens]
MIGSHATLGRRVDIAAGVRVGKRCTVDVPGLLPQRHRRRHPSPGHAAHARGHHRRLIAASAAAHALSAARTGAGRHAVPVRATHRACGSSHQRSALPGDHDGNAFAQGRRSIGAAAACRPSCKPISK